MVLRKHLSAGRITEVLQHENDRIIEILIETVNELGFNVNKRLIIEIMGKHSNIILVDIASGKIIDSIKRVGFDVNRVRQLLPGLIYQYPPEQDKVPFAEISDEELAGLPANGKAILGRVGGISPALAEELALRDGSAFGGQGRYEFLQQAMSATGPARVYMAGGSPVDFYPVPLSELESSCETIEFPDISAAMEFFFDKKTSSNQGKQKSHDLIKSVTASLDKMYLKKKRLSEDLLKAENSEDLRLYGELLTANIHLIEPGMKSVEVTNYYDGSTIKIPLDEKLSGGKNAQKYFKRYGKAKTAIKEKQIQLE